jgi:SAM-dependent methyltransferase
MQGNIVIGVVCGATLRGIAHYFWEHRPYSLKPDQRSQLTFISLNTAGLCDNLQFSGMYQAVFLAEAFEGASHSVELPNFPSCQRTEKHPQFINLLLCSAGGREDGFLSNWLRDPRYGLTLSEDVVGDFCLWPINANGEVVIDDPRVQEVIAELSLKPVFQELADIKKKNLCDRVVFPITSNRRHYPGEEVSPEDMTDKEPITRAVLESGIVSHCIMDHVLAENILWNTNAELCGYHLLTVSHETATEITYSALRHKDKKVVPVRIIRAPQELLNREYHHVPADTSSSPYEIIVSDPPCSADENPCDDREFPVCVDGQVKNIWLRPGVRKPGFWSTTTIRVARNVISKMKRTDLNILDLGCGSGIVGLVLGQHPDVRHVLSSDIDPEAIECARANIPFWSSGQVAFDTRVGDLFDVIASTEFFDLIVFTPPFYPAFMKDDPEYRAMGLIATDIGGPTGMELAERFATQVKQYLAPGGMSITYMADYVGYRQIRNALWHAGLKTEVQKRDILYPYEPRHGFAPANEIRWRAELEKFYQYRYMDHSFDNRRFLGFKIIHLIAERPE